MLINLTDIFTDEELTISKEIPLEFENVRFGGEVFPVTDKSPVSLTLTNNGKGHAMVSGKATVTASLKCDRCLSDVPYVFDLTIECELRSPDVTKREDQDDEEGFMEGYQLNVDSLMCNEIITSWPMKILCREDCKGLCTVCGRNLNHVECECDTFVPDPRMAAIMDIFCDNKEV